MTDGTDSPAPSPDYTTYSPTDLITRITDLEAQLHATTSQLSALRASAPPHPNPPPSRKKPKASKPFDPSRFSTRLVAFKFSYLGQYYNGFEHANGTVPPKPTIEEVLWKALRKARLISPKLSEGADDSMEVVWDAEARLARYASAEEGSKGAGKQKLELNWDGCEYSKCGRTDRGVSAFGQVIGIRLRSNAPKVTVQAGGEEQEKEGGSGVEQLNHDSTILSPASASASASASATSAPLVFDPVRDEMPYLSILNAILPPSIRMLAWCPAPPEGFDARFSCKERQYKYFFTNPAFLPTPGPLGMKLANGSPAPVREGWLDIEAMRKAAKKLEGCHDYRNLCKIDPSKQMSSCERRIGFADVALWSGAGAEFVRSDALNATARREDDGNNEVQGPRVYCFSVHGSAFLWHQVRCMVAVLFLVGQGLEQPEIVADLLDVDKNPQKPMYEMADDGPLVLWDCVFESPEDGGRGKLDWIYAGDEAMVSALTTKNDSKFGLGGLVDTLWTGWRKAKLEETVTGGLLDLALCQGDGTPLSRGGFRDPSAAQRSQKIFDGGDAARVIGAYTPMSKKQKMDGLEQQNEKYRQTRGARREARLGVVSGDD